MSFVGNIIRSVSSVLEFNAATLSGAIDIVVVRQPDGQLRCTPFHVRFGKLQVLRSKEKVVSIWVNGERAAIQMKLGASGEAFFVQESEVPVSGRLATSPINDAMRMDSMEELEKFTLGGDELPPPPAQEDKEEDEEVDEDEVVEDVQPSQPHGNMPPVGAEGHPLSDSEFELHPTLSTPMQPLQDFLSDPGAGEGDDEPVRWEWGALPHSDSEGDGDAGTEDVHTTPGGSRALSSSRYSVQGSSVAPPEMTEAELDALESSMLSDSDMDECATDGGRALGGLRRAEVEGSAGGGGDDEDEVGRSSWMTSILRMFRRTADNLPYDMGDAEYRREDEEEEEEEEDDDELQFGVDEDEDIEAGRRRAGRRAASREEPAALPSHARVHLGVPARESRLSQSLPATPVFLPPPGARTSPLRQRHAAAGGEEQAEVEMSLCGNLISESEYGDYNRDVFREHLITFEQFHATPSLLYEPNLVFRIRGRDRLYSWHAAAPLLVSILAFQRPLSSAMLRKVERDARGNDQEKESSGWWWWRSPTKGRAAGRRAVPAPSLHLDVGGDDTHHAPRGPGGHHNHHNHHHNHHHHNHRHRHRHNRARTSYARKSMRPTSEQLAQMGLQDGPNSIVFKVNSRLQGERMVAATVYVWNYSDRIVVSDVDGTITRSDVLGQLLPVVGKDWSHTDVANLFKKITANGYKMLYLTSRAIGQSNQTRNYLQQLRQGENALPQGPIIMSPDRLFTSFAREVIRRKPEEFKIAALCDIRDLFPKTDPPFYAGFGNRVNDAIAYRESGVPPGKIFIINPNSEIKRVHDRYKSSYTQMSEISDAMFPPLTERVIPDDYNDFNFWKAPVMHVDIDLGGDLGTAPAAGGGGTSNSSAGGGTPTSSAASALSPKLSPMRAADDGGGNGSGGGSGEAVGSGGDGVRGGVDSEYAASAAGESMSSSSAAMTPTMRTPTGLVSEADEVMAV